MPCRREGCDWRGCRAGILYPADAAKGACVDREKGDAGTGTSAEGVSAGIDVSEGV